LPEFDLGVDQHDAIASEDSRRSDSWPSIDYVLHLNAQVPGYATTSSGDSGLIPLMPYLVEHFGEPGIAEIRLSLLDRRVAPIMWQKLVFSLGLYGWFAVFTLILQAQLGFEVSDASFFFCAFGLASVVFEVGVVGTSPTASATGAHRTSAS
jgi:hypothetical protein